MLIDVSVEYNTVYFILNIRHLLFELVNNIIHYLIICNVVCVCTVRDWLNRSILWQRYLKIYQNIYICWSHSTHIYCIRRHLSLIYYISKTKILRLSLHIRKLGLNNNKQLHIINVSHSLITSTQQYDWWHILHITPVLRAECVNKCYT